MANVQNKRNIKARAYRETETGPGAWGFGRTATGKEQVGVSFAFTGEHLEQNSAITWYGYFTEGTFERTIESLRYMGWTGDDLTELADGGGTLDANEVELVLADEEYEGRWSTKVQFVNRGGGASMKNKLERDEVAIFAASMKDRIRAMQAAKGERPTQQAKAAAPAQRAAPRQAAPARSQVRAVPPPAQPEPPPLTDDDIPF